MIYTLLLFAGISITEKVVTHDPIVIQADDVCYARLRANPRRVRVVLRRPRWSSRVVLIEQEATEKKCDCKKDK